MVAKRPMNGQFHGCSSRLLGLRSSELALRGGGADPAASFGDRDACESAVDRPILSSDEPIPGRELSFVFPHQHQSYTDVEERRRLHPLNGQH